MNVGKSRDITLFLTREAGAQELFIGIFYRVEECLLKIHVYKDLQMWADLETGSLQQPPSQVEIMLGVGS